MKAWRGTPSNKKNAGKKRGGFFARQKSLGRLLIKVSRAGLGSEARTGTPVVLMEIKVILVNAGSTVKVDHLQRVKPGDGAIREVFITPSGRGRATFFMGR